MVGLTGFEPTTSRSRTERSTKLSHSPTLTAARMRRDLSLSRLNTKIAST